MTNFVCISVYMCMYMYLYMHFKELIRFEKFPSEYYTL